MAKVLKLAVILIASVVTMTTAHAVEKKPDNLLEGLVQAAVPNPNSVEDMVYSGSLGVTRFVLCTVGKSLGRKAAKEKGTCPK